MKTLALAPLLAVLAAPLVAQVPVPSAVPAPVDPARLAASERLIAVLMPPGRRDAMLSALMQAQTANMTKAIESNAELAAMFDADPRARAIFTRFIERQQADASATLRRELPGMMTAMTRAHARRFTVAQLGEMTTFFASPTGRAYMELGTTIMTDPDVAAWQQKVMGETFAKMPAMVRQMQGEILALPSTSGK